MTAVGSSEESPHAGETDRRGGLGLLVTIYEAYISYVSYINTTFDVIIYEAYIC